jgi:DNA ligase (NAD+)
MASEYIGKIRWNDSRIEVYLTDAENNDDVKLQRLIFFFETIGVENLSDKTYEEFFKNGIDTVRKILQLSPKDLENWDGFGKRKAEIIVNSIKKAWNEASFVQIMHGSCCFPTLGGDKLTLITESNVYKKSAPGTITTDVLVSIKGIGEEAAKIFVNNFNKFSIFFSEIESLYTEKKKQEEKPTAKTGNKCQNWNVVFTGFRDKTIENYIVEEGGSIANGVSSKTTHLIMKEKGSGSVKEKKAMELNMQILNEKDIRNFFHYKDIKTEDKRSII